MKFTIDFDRSLSHLCGEVFIDWMVNVSKTFIYLKTVSVCFEELLKSLV